MRSELMVAVAAAALSLPPAALADPTRAGFKAEKERLESQFDLAKEKCRTFGGNARDICLAEAEGSYKVAVAELEELRSPGSRSRHKVRIARAEADYEIAMQECDERSGATREACLQEARASFTSDKADARQDRR